MFVLPSLHRRKIERKFVSRFNDVAGTQITPVPTLETVHTAGGWWVPTRVCLRLSRPAVPALLVPGSLAPLSACCGPAVHVIGHRLAVDLDCCREPLA